MPVEWKVVLDRCLRRISVWRPPPNCNHQDWMEEMRAQGAAAAWQAVCDFDPKRGVPPSAFLRQRVLTSLLTRYRQDWSHALHCVEWEGSAPSAAPQEPPELSHVDLYAALDQLCDRDRRLLLHLYWDQHTEAEIAASRQISQQAISKRKRLLLKTLRSYMESEETS